MSEEMQLVAAMIAEDTDTEEESHYSGLLIYDMKTSNNQPHMNPPLIGRKLRVAPPSQGRYAHGNYGPGQLMEVCRGIVDMDCGKSDEVEAMGKQIFKTSRSTH